MCPHNTVCPHTTMYVCPHTTMYVCPDTTIYVYAQLPALKATWKARVKSTCASHEVTLQRELSRVVMEGLVEP